MKQKIVFLKGTGIRANDREKVNDIIDDFKRDFDVVVIAQNGDDALYEAGALEEEAVDAVRTADIWVIAGASLSQHPVAGLLDEMKADCQLFVVSLDPVKWPEICKGRQVQHFMQRIPAGLRRLRRMLLPVRIYVSNYENVGYVDLKDMLERYPLMEGQAEVETYWQDEYHLENLLEMLSQSVYYRAQIQKRSVAETLNGWLKEAPALRQVCDPEALRQALEACKEQMGDFMLVRLPKDSTLTFNGQVYQGIEAIKQADGNGAVFSACQLFPCFDSSDYAYENRYYRNYWFCGQDPSARAVVQSLKAKGNPCCIGEDLPKEALPMVYYEDDWATLLAAYEG